MLKNYGTVKFGEWLPDQPYYDNPGLVEALNVIPVDGSYKDYLPLSTSGDAITARPQGAYAGLDASGEPEIYVGTDSKLLQKNGTGWDDRSGTAYATASNGYWRFSQYGKLVMATNFANDPVCRTVGSASNFSTLATSTAQAPKARQIGVIGDFVVLGDTSDVTNGDVPYRVQWSAIANPRNWPTPLTADARANQAGDQFNGVEYGAVTAIGSGQFFGLVFQQRGINRYTYVGGDTVFQIETFEKSRGCWVPQSMTQVGDVYYFLAVDGFYRTNGQQVEPIGTGRVDKYFYSNFDQQYRERLTVAVDYQNKCILWAYPDPSATSGVPNRLIIYNWQDNRWSRAEDGFQLIFSSYTTGYTLDQLDSLYTSIDDMTVSLDSTLWQGGTPSLAGFASNKLGTFSGTSADARLETGEIDANPTGLGLVKGVKPLVTGDPTGLSVAISARSTQDNLGRTFGTPASRTSRTGICDVRVKGRYLSARVAIEGGFDRAIGIQYDITRTHAV